MTTQVSLSSVLKRTGKSIEAVLSAVDILDDVVCITTNYTSRIREEQVKEAEQKALEFNNQLALRKANSVIDFTASSYQIGAKSRQLKSLPEFDSNIEAFRELTK